MTEEQSIQALHDIKRIMERSTRFLSLSGLSGVGAGITALAGAFVAQQRIDYYKGLGLRNQLDDNAVRWDQLRLELLILAGAILIIAFSIGFYFTWRKASREGASLWDNTSRKMAMNMVLSLGTGGLFILGSIYHQYDLTVGPACLVFYGLALINVSKYTVRDVRYLGLSEIALGLINLFFFDVVGYSLMFWALGFGVCHILYGGLMWWKYERAPAKV
ncbi:hypothetical protein GA0116948_106152 [Chitinophaga costaii]|uniref:Uncharacterized protein n=1 Tax=Chitinophaga costaii TaxID=1335309 RepID=A0A1C4DWC9_9BACT|nr:hypothetical protein [Chitinophaga costaii]PUZ27831.1 hypothetical protein DCM91_06390 [Chitinophaga costaii]SCC35545.1 hypothetical protein GA0116948_106152 [Chitinophaga costaii]